MHRNETSQADPPREQHGEVPGLKICGPNGGAYIVGKTMHLSCAWGNLGHLTPTFSLGKTDRVMHIERFHPTSLVLENSPYLGRWMLYEICAFAARELPQVTVLHFALSRPLDSLGTPSDQVLARLAALDRIGAEATRFGSKGDAMHVIEGVWRPSPANVKKLADALANDRAELRLTPMKSVREASALGAVLRNRLSNVRRFLAG